MTPEDRDQANAALLLNDKIDERIAEALRNPAVLGALLDSPLFRQTLEGYVHNEIAQAFAQFHERVKPTYYYGPGTSYHPKRYW